MSEIREEVDRAFLEACAELFEGAFETGNADEAARLLAEIARELRPNLRLLGKTMRLYRKIALKYDSGHPMPEEMLK